MSQSPSPTSPSLASDRRTDNVLIGKRSGFLEVQFSANDTIRTIIFPLPILALLASNLRVGRSLTLVAQGILATDERINGEIRGHGD